MLFDKAKIYVEGGRGGDGCVSFRREAHVPRGGPNGGDGGRGGDVVVACDPSWRDLAALGRSRHFRGGGGGHGQGNQRHGARGDDRELAVPPGTVIETLAGEEVELLEAGQRVVVARGGEGGHGNRRFAGPTRQAPRFAERGLEGGSGWIELRLKLFADAGLIGQPNAGKSSLLKRLTRASPKIADYPFTTIEPVLGTIGSDDGQVVVADIPGLIEGAAQGAGLGHEFLAHLERCRMLVHLVDVSSDEAPESAYGAVRSELSSYGAGLDALPELVALSKVDLISEERRDELLTEWRARLGDDVGVLGISSATGEGLDELRRAILERVGEAEGVTSATFERSSVARSTPSSSSAGVERFESEHRVYRPGEDEGFEVLSIGEHRFRIKGRGIELLLARHDPNNAEAMAYVEQRMKEIGVISELQKAGFESGDEVVIGDLELELHPG